MRCAAGTDPGRRPACNAAINTLAQIAEQYSDALGRKISYVDVPVAPLEDALRQSGMSPHVAAHLITMGALHRQNRYDRLIHDVEKLTGSPPMSIADFVRMDAAEFAPQES